MWKEIVGVAVGAVIGVGIVKVLIDRKKEGEKSLVTVKSQSDGEIKLKDFSSLLQEQLVVEYLSGDELSKWFKENSELDNHGVNKIIAYPTKDVINGLGYEFNSELDANKSMIQLFYKTEAEEIAKVRFISFSEIDSKLEEMLKKDGMLVID